MEKQTAEHTSFSAIWKEMQHKNAMPFCKAEHPAGLHAPHPRAQDTMVRLTFWKQKILWK